MLQLGWNHLHDKCSDVEGIPTSEINCSFNLFVTVLTDRRSGEPSLVPASLPPAAGGRLGRPGGDDLAVDGAEKQHEPDGAKHLGGWDAMIVVDGHVEERRCHCKGEGFEKREIISSTTERDQWQTSTFGSVL